MSNCLVTVRWTLDVPEEALAKMVGRADDDSGEWWQDAGEAAKDYVENNLMDAIGRFGHAYEPDVEVN